MTRSIVRREFLLRWAAGGLALASLGRRYLSAADPTPNHEGEIDWYDVKEWGVEGKGWTDTARYFDRLPKKAEASVRGAVWELSRHSAGMLVRFRTPAPTLHVRYRLSSDRLAMPHMPATGVSGLDLYVQSEDGRERWLGVTRPASQQGQEVIGTEIDPHPAGSERQFTIYLPLYNGIEELEIGVPHDAPFAPVAPRTEKPLVFYGTSIMHGACASRPGMAISAILGRRLSRPMINLGFSGNGLMEPEVAALLAELDPCLYAIDCLPNMQAPQVAERAEPLVKLLRDRHPATPILLVEDRTYTYAHLRQSARDRQAGSRRELRAAYNRLLAAGIDRLYYLEGDQLLGDDSEAATDGSHPSDLGMVRYADAYEPILRQALS